MAQCHPPGSDACDLLSCSTFRSIRGARRGCGALALFAIVLLSATWGLWTPQTVFPRVPLMYGARWIPSGVEWLLAGMVVGSLTVAAAVSKPDWAWRAALRVFVGAMASLMLIDQHRLQPWAYQAVLVALALANCPPPRGFALMRLLTVSIYFYSGISKLDYEFLHTLGQQFLAALLGVVGFSLDSWSQAGRLIAAAALPLAEIAVAGGFCFRRSWRAALVGSLFLHGGLLVVLGPWGLHHSLAVLIWNAYFMAQNVLLFAEAAPSHSPQPAATPQRRDFPIAPQFDWARTSQLATQAVLIAAVLLPLGEPWGWYDAWPSWSLYAPSSERVTLLVHRGALGQLGELARFAAPAAPDEEWIRLRTDRWSLERLSAPIYPQNRFQLGLAEAVGTALHLDHRIRAVEISRSDRLTGKRQHRILSGITEISAAADRFPLNGRPDGRFLPATGPEAAPAPE